MDINNEFKLEIVQNDQLQNIFILNRKVHKPCERHLFTYNVANRRQLYGKYEEELDW